MEVQVVSMREIVKPDEPRVFVVNTTSRATTEWERQLSPFFLGPIDLYDNFRAKNLENAWQFCKVYKKHTDYHGNPSNDYWKWAQEGWDSEWAYRYPMGKDAVPLYSDWKGEKLGYIEARKCIYAPLYADAVQRTAAFQKLLIMRQRAQKIILRDFDGYDHKKLGMTLTDVLNNPKRKMGHAFVLAALLTNDESIKQWKRLPK